MASVDLWTADYTDGVFDENIVDGDVDGSGHLILTKRGGGTVDAGSVIGPTGSPGAAGSTLLAWNQATAYTTGQVVGYAGRFWKALSNNTNKPPLFFTSVWLLLTGGDANAWYQMDPYFTSDTITTGWETFWKTGTSVVTRSTTAGDFETGVAAMKIALSASSSQRVYEKEENNVHGGEVISVTVRAKLQAAAAGCTMAVALLQNDGVNPPAPLSTGLSQVSSQESNPTLTTTWTTYKFNMVAANAKLRGQVSVSLIQAAGNSSVVLIDRIEIKRGWDTGLRPVTFGTNCGNYGGGFAACTYENLKGEVNVQGLMYNGAALADGATLFSVPVGHRILGGTQLFHLGSSSGFLRVDVLANGNVTLSTQGLSLGAWVSLENLDWRAG